MDGAYLRRVNEDFSAEAQLACPARRCPQTLFIAYVGMCPVYRLQPCAGRGHDQGRACVEKFVVGIGAEVEGEIFGAKNQPGHARTGCGDGWGLNQPSGVFDQGYDANLAQR